MSKRKISKKSMETKSDDSEEKSSAAPDQGSGEERVKKQISESCEGLFYTSETDAEIRPFFGGQANAVTAEELLSQLKLRKNELVEEVDFKNFFARLTENQDWFGDDEKATAAKFSDLQNLLESNFRDLKIFKVGKIQLDIYAVGLDAENNLLGIQTKAVET